MENIIKTAIMFLGIFTLSWQLSVAQSDTEFPKGFILHVGIHNGMISEFSSKPELFVGGVNLLPQVTIVPNLLRAGMLAGGFYAANKINGDVGPVLSVKVKSFNASMKGASVGSLGNLHLRVDHLWTTGKQQLLGGGLFCDLGNLLLIGVTGHRDYKMNTWWFQSQLAVRISRKSKLPEI